MFISKEEQRKFILVRLNIVFGWNFCQDLYVKILYNN